MKKSILSCTFLIILIMLFCVGCNKVENDTSKTFPKDNEKIELDTEDYIQEAIDKANLIAGGDYILTQEGYTYFSGGYFQIPKRNFAYCYYGKNIKQLRQNAATDIGAIMEDGSFYFGNTLVTNEYDIKDILWQTTGYGMDAYLITESGKVLYYSPRYHKNALYDTNELKEMEIELEEVVVGCRWREEVIFLNKEGQVFERPSNKWNKCEIDGWKNCVVLACAKNEEDGTESIAGISADGKVYAAGDYAEEILSWGELAYISMEDNLIVGLTKDGSLRFAGKKADIFSQADFGQVEAVRVFDDKFVALTEKGCIRELITYFEGDIQYINEEKAIYGYYMDKNGNIYEEYEGVWKKSTYTPAISGEEVKLLYMSALTENEISWGKGDDYENYETHSIEFQFADINADGVEEILLTNNMASGFEGTVGIGHLYNGEMRVFFTSNDIRGYYPESGIFVSDTWLGGNMSTSYWKYNGKSAIELFSCYANMEKEETTYYVSKMLEAEIEAGEEEVGEQNDNGTIEVTEEIFNSLKKNYIGEQELCKIDGTKYAKNTKENRIDILLSDILKEQDEIVPEDKTASEIQNPIIKNKEMVEWDTITFGSYWKHDTNGDGIADEADEKEPIRWRVLSCDGEVALLLSEDSILLGKASDWINDFQKEAFTKDELKCIQMREGQEEKIFLLSLEEVKNSEYGFDETEADLASRKCDFTEFILNKINSMSKEEHFVWDEGAWWLSSKGKELYYYRDENDMGRMKRGFEEAQYYVDYLGGIDVLSNKKYVMGIRPAIYLNLSDEAKWDYAGTVSTEDCQEVEYR